MYCTNCGEKNGQDSRFCSNCGQSMKTSQSVANGNNLIDDVPPDGDINFVEIASSVAITIDLDGGVHSIADFENICSLIGKYTKSKYVHKILYNIYISNEYLVIFPVSKDKSNLAMLGLLLGGGALGGAAVVLLQHAAKKIEKSESEIDLGKENILNNSIIYNTKNICLKFKESTTTSGVFFSTSTVDTHFKIMGSAIFNGKSYRLEVNFSIPGQCSDNSKCKLSAFNILTSKLGIANPVITKGKDNSFPAEWSLFK